VPCTWQNANAGGIHTTWARFAIVGRAGAAASDWERL